MFKRIAIWLYNNCIDNRILLHKRDKGVNNRRLRAAVMEALEPRMMLSAAPLTGVLHDEFCEELLFC